MQSILREEKYNPGTFRTLVHWRWQCKCGAISAGYFSYRHDARTAYNNHKNHAHAMAFRQRSRP